jgi:hypothetical protein
MMAKRPDLSHFSTLAPQVVIEDPPDFSPLVASLVSDSGCKMLVSNAFAKTVVHLVR